MSSGGKFRSLVCTRLGKTFDEGIDSLEIQPKESDGAIEDNEVRVKIQAFGLNYFDLLMLVGKYQVRPEPPFVPCSEAAGVVIEAGKSSNLKKGDRVFVYSLCSAQEEMVVPADKCTKFPQHMSVAQAAGLPSGIYTAYHGLVQRGELKRGEYLLVTGAAGGMGAAACALGKALGAKVIAVVSSDEKKKFIEQNQLAHHVINYTKENLKDRVAQITDSHYADVIYETVGGDLFNQTVRCVAGRGRLLVIGFASGKIPTIAVNLALIKGFSIVGVRAGAELGADQKLYDDMNKHLGPLLEKGLISPTVQVFPAAQAREAFRVLSNRKAMGKVIVSWEEKPKL